MKQYNVTLPLSVEDYWRGVKYVDYLIDFDLSKQTQQKVELLSQTPYSKMYYLLNYLPQFIQQLLKSQQLQIQEKRLKIEQGDQRVIHPIQFPQIEIIITTIMGQQKISMDVKPEIIDPVTEHLDYFRGYEKDVERRLKDGFGIMEFSNWKRYCPNLLTCQINIQISVNYGEESIIIEQYLQDQCRKYLLYYYKSMLLTYKSWNHLSDTELFRLNKQVLLSQSAQRINGFAYQINTLQDLFNKTNYKELKKTHLYKYNIKGESIIYSTPAKRSNISETRSPYLTMSRTQDQVKKTFQKKKAGQIYKKGDGPIDYNWNPRYIVLDGETLVYFKDKFDKVPRGVINLRDSYISTVSSADDREHCFYIEAQNKFFYFSGETAEETEQWREDISQATMENTPSQSEHRLSYTNYAVNTYLLTDQIPQTLQQILKNKKINIQLDNYQKEWQFRKFRNGVRIYEKPQQPQKSSMFKYILCLLILLLSGGISYYYNKQPIFIAVLIIVLTYLYFSKKNKKEKHHIYARLICDIDSQKAFDLVKNLKNKQIFDTNFVQIQKEKIEQQEMEFEKRAIGHFVIYPIRQKQIVSKPIVIQLKLQRFRFLLKDSGSFVVDITSCSKFNMLEIFEIQRIPKVTGKGIINYYCEIDTSLKYKNVYDKYLIDKAQNLSLISQTIDEQRFLQFQQSIVNELQSSIRQSRVIDTFNKDFKDQVQYITQLKAGSCTYRGKKLEERMPGYRRFKEGGVECFNKEEIRSQDGLVLDLMRQAGRQLFEGRNIISVSLPVRIFEPRSMIERICDWWGFIPIYLEYALLQNDERERFKCVVTMILGGLYNGGRQKKPFNPILGETYQGSWQDGTQIFIEHTSHHPPISHFYIEHAKKKYVFYGHYEYQAALRYNAVIGHQIGDCVIQFSDGQKIIYNMPPARVNGLLYGARVLEWYNEVKFNDERNGLQCEVKFSEGAGMLIGRDAKPTDYFEGTLFQHNRVIGKVQGSWLESILWDGLKYWDIEKIDPAILIRSDEPLPSDCRYRTDLIELENGDQDRAQEEKTRLEIIQRKDRKLRADYKVANKNK